MVVHIRHHDGDTGTSRGSTRTSCGVHPAGAHVSDCNCDDDRDSVDMNRVGIPDVSTSIGGFLHEEKGG